MVFTPKYPGVAWLSAITLFGFALRLQLLDRFALHRDEAIYAFWARYFWENDLLFLSVWPDKPPLFIVLLSAALELLGTDPAASRYLNIAISTLTIPVVAALATRLWHGRSGLAAAAAMAFSPYAISFSPTLFTDPLLVLAGSLGIYFALRRRLYWTGFWVGVAIMTKQQGLLYLPLIAMLLAVGGGRISRIEAPRALTLLFAGLLTVLLPVLYWDSLRWDVAPSPWDLAVRNYGVLSLLPLAEWPTRIASWRPLLLVMVSGWVIWLSLAILPIWSALSRIYRQRRGANTPIAAGALPNTRFYLILLWGAFFCLLHIAASVAIWDRYLLPLAPLVALTIGWIVTTALARVNAYLPWRRSPMPAIALVALTLLPAATSAATGGYPIGGDRGAYSGLQAALSWLQTEAPSQAILYHRSLGWHYQFYLYDDVQTGDIQLRWFPSEVYLADNVIKAAHRARFVLQPDWEPLRGLDRQLQIRRFNMKERFNAGHFTVYEIVYVGPASCAWCLCELRPEWTSPLPDWGGEVSGYCSDQISLVRHITESRSQC